MGGTSAWQYTLMGNVLFTNQIISMFAERRLEDDNLNKIRLLVVWDPSVVRSEEIKRFTTKTISSRS